MSNYEKALVAYRIAYKRYAKFRDMYRNMEIDDNAYLCERIKFDYAQAYLDKAEQDEINN